MISFLTKFDSVRSRNIVIPDTSPLLTIYEPRKLRPIHRMMHRVFAREVWLKRNNDQINYHDSEKRRLNVNYFRPPPPLSK